MQNYKTLNPILLKQNHIRPIEKKIFTCLYEVIFKDIIELFEEFSKGVITNSDSDFTYLMEAIKSGRIQFAEGKFSGKFNAKLSRILKELGAVFNHRTKTFNIKEADLPLDIQYTVAQVNIKLQKLYEKVLKKISEIDSDKVRTYSFIPDYVETLTDFDEQLYKTVKKEVSVIPEFTDIAKKVIARDYSENLKLYIKKFTDEQTLKLRKEVEKNVFEHGRRASSLVKIIQDRYNVSKSKAVFLSKQETSLLMSRFRQERYQSIGLNEYTWTSAGDERVRDDHKHLNRTLQTWDSPPIVNRLTGKRANPGEDFGCRCICRPIVRF